MHWTFSRHPNGLALKGTIPGGAAATVVTMPDDAVAQIVGLQSENNRLRNAVALLNSMILSGEDHSEISRAVVRDALT